MKKYTFFLLGMLFGLLAMPIAAQSNFTTLEARLPTHEERLSFTKNLRNPKILTVYPLELKKVVQHYRGFVLNIDGQLLVTHLALDN